MARSAVSGPIGSCPVRGLVTWQYRHFARPSRTPIGSPLKLGRAAGRGDGSVEGRAIPALALGRLIIRQPGDVVAAARVAADRRQVSVVGPKRILDDRVEDFVPDPRFFVERARRVSECVGHIGVVGIGQGSVREGESRRAGRRGNRSAYAGWRANRERCWSGTSRSAPRPRRGWARGSSGLSAR